MPSDILLESPPTHSVTSLSSDGSHLGGYDCRPNENSNKLAPVEHDSLYFLPSAFVYFQVERHLFCVPTYKFVDESQAFTQLFKLPQPNSRDVKGSCREDPIIVPDTTKSDFRSLLKAFYPLPVSVGLNLSKFEWISVLELSTRWYFLKYRKLAISCLNDGELRLLRPDLKIVYGRQFMIRVWIEEGCEKLVKRRQTISKPEVARIGFETAFALFRIREVFMRTRKGGPEPEVMKLIREDLQDELDSVEHAEACYSPAVE